MIVEDTDDAESWFGLNNERDESLCATSNIDDGDREMSAPRSNLFRGMIRQAWEAEKSLGHSKSNAQQESEAPSFKWTEKIDAFKRGETYESKSKKSVLIHLERSSSSE